MKARKAYVWQGSKEEAEAVLKENGSFHLIKTVSKRMAREGLLFSAVDITGIRVESEDIVDIDDIERNGYTFTDGCGESLQVSKCCIWSFALTCFVDIRR